MATVLLNANNTWADIEKNKEFGNATEHCNIRHSSPVSTDFTKLTLSIKDKSHSQSGLKRAREWIIARRDEQIKSKFPSMQGVSRTICPKNNLLFNRGQWEKYNGEIILVITKYTNDYSIKQCGDFVILNLPKEYGDQMQSVRDEIIKTIDSLPRVRYYSSGEHTSSNTSERANQIQPQPDKDVPCSTDTRTDEQIVHETASIKSDGMLTTNQIHPTQDHEATVSTDKQADDQVASKTDSITPDGMSTANQIRPKHADCETGSPDRQADDHLASRNDSRVSDGTQIANKITPNNSNDDLNTTARTDESIANNYMSLNVNTGQNTTQTKPFIDHKKPIAADRKTDVSTLADKMSADISGIGNINETQDQRNSNLKSKSHSSGSEISADHLSTNFRQSEAGIGKVNTPPTSESRQYTFLTEQIPKAVFETFIKAKPLQKLQEEFGLNLVHANTEKNMIRIKGLNASNLPNLPDINTIYGRFDELFLKYCIFKTEETRQDGKDAQHKQVYKFMTTPIVKKNLQDVLLSRIRKFEADFKFSVVYKGNKDDAKSLIGLEPKYEATENNIKYAYEAFETIFIKYLENIQKK